MHNFYLKTEKCSKKFLNENFSSFFKTLEIISATTKAYNPVVTVLLIFAPLVAC